MASSFQADPPPRSTVRWLAAPLRRIQTEPMVERPARVLEQVADAVLVSPRVRSLLRGEQFGHAVHPPLTDFPLGAWTATSLLDLFGGCRARAAATGLLAFGIAAAVPTVLAGLAEWQATTGPARRVGVVHAAVNTTALGLYVSSLGSRLAGRHRRAVGLALAGGVAATVGGYLGGHLSLVLKVGTGDPALRPVSSALMGGRTVDPVGRDQPPIGGHV
jgi:hypothetical protein